MAKPRHPAYNRPDTPKGPGEGEERAVAAEAEAEVRGGKQGDEEKVPTPPAEGGTRDRSATRSQGLGQRPRRRGVNRMWTGKERPQGGKR